MFKTSGFLDRFDFREQYLSTRHIKAEKILAVLRREIQSPDKATLVDLGCNQGQITGRLAEVFHLVVGVDIDFPSQDRRGRSHLIQADGTQLPFRSSSLDIVVLNHVLEHVADQTRLLSETWRVLKPKGICYLSCPNRYTLVEPHYRLPFLSWLPRGIANSYVRLAARGKTYLDDLPSYRRLKSLTRQFTFEDKTLAVLEAPELLAPGDDGLKLRSRLAGWIPIFLKRALLPLSPVWIVILRKEIKQA
jgi:ubiquinone/menaquinone biosynthesis C-methylase UbiE